MPGYIYQRDNWTKFTWDSNALAKPLAAVWQSQGRLMGRMTGLGFSLQEEAVLETLTEEVVKSSEIEGEILDKEQVRSSIARRLGIEASGLTPADRNVEGVVEMMLDATQHYQKKLTAERLFTWHAALFPSGRSGMHKIVVGRWRDGSHGPMQVVSGPAERQRIHFEAPDAKRVPHEMKRFLAWFETKDELDLILKAAIAHLWFVTIHPFEDGNGRIARAIADMALARSENSTQRFYSMSAQIRLERAAYYDVLETTQKGTRDITQWLIWFLACLGRALDGADTISRNVLDKATFWQKYAGAPFNARQHDMLNRLLEGFEGKLTSTKYAKIEKCSQDTAYRDIVALVELGVLQKEAGGRSTNYSLVALEK